MEVNGPRGQKLVQGRNPWQKVKHVWLYTDLLQALKREPFRSGFSDWMRKRINHKICSWRTNAMEVQCRNSFHTKILHGPFAHFLNHAYRLQALLKNTKKPSLVSELSLTWPQPPSFGMLYHSQGSRFQSNILQTSKSSPVFWLTFLFQCLLNSLCHVTFLCLVKTFSIQLFFQKKKKVLQRTEH